jgi:hypothetical protein
MHCRNQRTPYPTVAMPHPITDVTSATVIFSRTATSPSSVKRTRISRNWSAAFILTRSAPSWLTLLASWSATRGVGMGWFWAVEEGTGRIETTC